MGIAINLQVNDTFAPLKKDIIFFEYSIRIELEAYFDDQQI
jgi:hypothetical protein